MCRFNVPLKVFQAINNTATDNQKQRKPNTTYTLNTKDKQKKTLPASKTNCILVWYAFYDLRPGNAAGPILTAPEPTKGTSLNQGRGLGLETY